MINDHLLAIAARAPAANGLVHAGVLQPYSRIVERVAGLAAGLASRGIGRGDPIAILMPNSPELFVTVHALFALGAIAMPLGTAMTAAELARAGRKAGIRALVADAERTAVATEVAAGLGGAGPLPVFAWGEAPTAHSLAELERTSPVSLVPPPPEAPALYLLSSGSTGLPKVVPHSHAELLADGRRTSTAWGMTADDIVFDMLPGNFAMGLLLGAMDALAVGATTVYWNDPRPLVLARRQLLESLAMHRVTVMGAVPAMYDVLVGAAGERLPDLRLAFSGGAALRRPTFEAFEARFGLPLRQAYGSTEAIMVSHNDDPEIDRHWDSVGRPAGDAEVRIAETDTGLGPDVGELMVRSSSLTSGYLDEHAATASAFLDGWLLTGDLARIDAEGRIYIKGRSKLLIEVSGFKIDPIEVEETLQLHPAVAEAAVVGFRPRPGADRQLKAVVVRSDDVAADQLVRFVRERLSAHKVPGMIEFRDSLPRSSAGKILRGELSVDG